MMTTVLSPGDSDDSEGAFSEFLGLLFWIFVCGGGCAALYKKFVEDDD